jgi:hypothetical protein
MFQESREEFAEEKLQLNKVRFMNPTFSVTATARPRAWRKSGRPCAAGTNILDGARFARRDR